MSARRARVRTTGAPSIAILGAGAAAAAFARSLAQAGIEVRVWARSNARARALVRALPRAARGRDRAPVTVMRTLEEIAAAKLVLLCVSDGAIEELAQALAAAVPDGRGRVALHTSGYLDARALGALDRARWHTGSLHPLLALPAASTASSLDGACFAVEGAPAARRAAARLVRALHGEVLELAGVDKPVYHTSAALLAGGLVVLLEAADRLLDGALGDPLRARRALVSLAESVLHNYLELGPARALTGPAARGDEKRVAGHLRVLRSRSPKASALYRELVLRMLALARERGDLDRVAQRRVEQALQLLAGQSRRSTTKLARRAK